MPTKVIPEESCLDCEIHARHFVKLHNSATNSVELYLIIDLPGYFRRRIGPFEDEAQAKEYLEHALDASTMCDLWNELDDATHSEGLPRQCRVAVDDGVERLPAPFDRDRMFQ